MQNCTTSVGWLDHPICSPSMNLLSRLAWLASRIVWSDCTKRLLAKQTNIGVTLSYGLVPETPSLCNHHCWHAKPAPFPLTMAFTFFCRYTHFQVILLLSLPVQHLAVMWEEASHSPDGLGCKWTNSAGTQHPWTSLEHFEGRLVPLCTSDSYHFLSTSHKFLDTLGLNLPFFQVFFMFSDTILGFLLCFFPCSMSC